MMVLFIAILFFIGVFFALLNRTRMCLATFVFAFICFLLAGSGLLHLILLDPLQKPFINLPLPQWKSRNAIVVLGAGVVSLPMTQEVYPTATAYSRIYTAARLYFACLKSRHSCTIIISGGDTMRRGESEASVYQKALVGLGVRDLDIVLESHSKNTYQNAERTKAIIKDGAFDQVILVSSAIHLRRALLYFSHFGIHVVPVAADYLSSQPTAIPLGYNFAATDFSIHEYMGIVRFYVYNFFGWNTSKS